MQLIVVEHQPDAPAGLVGDWAAERDIGTQVVRVHAGDPWPEPGVVEKAVVLGSDRSVHDDPPDWLGGELDWLRALDSGGAPVLGLCFGGQALAAALGGSVRRAERAEIGWVEVQGALEGTWFEWHFDTFSPPPGARELGRSPAALQGFAIGPHVALQFHPEVTPAIVDGWVTTGRGDLDGERLDGEAIRARTAQEAERARAAAFALFDGWVGSGRMAP
jgi:GMP synthase-like glutamine amidotransferase